MASFVLLVRLRLIPSSLMSWFSISAVGEKLYTVQVYSGVVLPHHGDFGPNRERVKLETRKFSLSSNMYTIPIGLTFFIIAIVAAINLISEG